MSSYSATGYISSDFGEMPTSSTCCVQKNSMNLVLDYLNREKELICDQHNFEPPQEPSRRLFIFSTSDFDNMQPTLLEKPIATEYQLPLSVSSTATYRFRKKKADLLFEELYEAGKHWYVDCSSQVRSDAMSTYHAAGGYVYKAVIKAITPEITYLIIFSAVFGASISALAGWVIKGSSFVDPRLSFISAVGALGLWLTAFISMRADNKDVNY